MQSFAIFSSSARVCVAPVGLHGKFSISTFDFGVIFSFSAAAVRREVILHAGGDRDRHAEGHDDARRIADVARLVVEHFVAGIQQRAQGEVDRLGDADGDDDFGARIVGDAEVLLHVAADGRAQLGQAEIGGVVRAALLERIDRRLADVPGRVEIGLADAEGDDLLLLRDDVEKLTDA